MISFGVSRSEVVPEIVANRSGEIVMVLRFSIQPHGGFPYLEAGILMKVPGEI